MQESLFKNADPGKRELLVPARMVLAELRRVNRRMGNLQADLRALERLICDGYEASRPRRHHSFEPAALAYLVELHGENPGAKSRQLIKQLMDKAAERGWRIGSLKTIYRVLKELRTGARLDITTSGKGVEHGGQQARREEVGGAHRFGGDRS